MLLLNQKMTESKAWEKGLVMELFKSDNFSEQVDNRVTVMAGLSNKLNTLVICHKLGTEKYSEFLREIKSS